LSFFCQAFAQLTILLIDDPSQGASAKLGHPRVGAIVVPDKTHRLLESPGRSPVPLKVRAAKTSFENPALGLLKQVPSRHKIESRIGRGKAAAIENSDQSFATSQQIGWD
jgi:hypothetical protein